MAVEQRFIMLKVADVEKHLSTEQIKNLTDVCQTIRDGRDADGKENDNFYAVINTDEPYFPEVKAIMRSYGHWEDEDEAIS